MPFLSFRKNAGLISLAAAAALMVPHFISSQVVPPAPAATLQPGSLAVDIAHDGAPIDLTATLTNTGGGTLTWRVGAIRDVSVSTAPAVAAGPVATARVYDKSNLDLAAFAAGEIIVGVKEAAPGSAAAKAAAPVSFLGGKAKIKREMIRARRGTRSASGAKRPAAPVLKPGRKLYLVTVDDKSKAGMQKALEDLRKDPNVAYAEPNYKVKAIGMPDDPDFGLLYGLHNSGQTGGVADADIDAPEAWDTYTGDHNVIVGVIDTGIDYLHPDLAENIWTNPGEIPGNGIDDDANGYIDDIHGWDFVNNDADPMDDHYHGTHCAGTIAGSGNNGVGVTGVAWKAKLAALKFLDAGGSGSTEAAIEAIAYANAMDIPITSNSWGGGGFSQALKDVIDAGGERGFLFVAAAGNNASDNDQFASYPASYESGNIVSVAATDSRDEMAYFSNYGAASVDLGAPGVDTYSCAPGNGYQYLSGTSMATPHVAGAAALIKSYNTQLGQAELKAALLAGVDPIPAMNGRTVSNGRLNVDKALRGVSPPWVTMSPRGPGELAAGASQILTARVDAKGLTAGEHRALVQIATNDPVAPVRELEIVARVSACRSLTVAPSALDFGGVWQGTSRRLSLTLINTCNDFTQLDAVVSSHAAFAAAGVLPLRIPPFGKATLEVVYTPDDLSADKAVLSLRSNAQDNPVLTVDAQGTGIVPPRISADPSRFELTLDPSAQAVRKLLVRNTGGDILNVKLSISNQPAPVPGRAIGPGKLIAGKAAAGKPYSTERGSLKASNLHPAFKASAADLRVLYLTTLLPDGAEDGLVRGLRGLPNVGAVDVVSGASNTPSLEYLRNYDVVVVSSNFSWADGTLLGNTLADYVDNGGGLCLMVAAIASGGGYGLSGRITDPEYMPIQMAGAGSFGEATEFATHPITEGVHSIQCQIPTSATSTQGGGIELGGYSNGSLLGAVNGDKPVVALNVYPQDGAWSGDLILMMGNTLEYLAGGAGWLKVEPRKAAIAPGESLEFTVSISADKQLAGDHEGAVEIAHNSPAGDNPLRVPVVMHVRAVSLLDLSPSKFDFGGVLVGGQGIATAVLTNAGNQATTVTGVVADKFFQSGTPAPFTVPAFSALPVQLIFSPKKEGHAAGSVTFASNASNHPTLSVALRGQGMPAPQAVLNPEKLSVSLAYNASPMDLTSTLSNKGRGILRYNIGSPKDVTPAPAATVAALADKAVQTERIYRSANYDLPAVPGQLLVGLNQGKTSLANASALTASGIAVKRSLARAAPPKGLPAWSMARKILLVTLADASRAGVLKAIAELRKDPNVAYAEPNYKVKAIGMPDDPDFGLLYGLHNSGQTGGVADADIDAPEAWDTYTGDHNVIVGVIDTGIDYLHPDLAENIWTNPGEIPGNGIDDDANGYIDDIHGWDFVNNDADPMDDHYHGTHCAGTIAGSGNNGVGVTGVAWKAKLAALKFLDAGGSGSTEAAIEAIAYANAMDIPITSNSWGGGGFSQALKDVIDAGGERGFLFVAAAGNNASDNDQFASYPASYESGNIVSVAATDSRDEMAYFSNYGAASVDLGAPGVDTYSCAPGNGYQYLSGTSMATPHVAGAAALIKSYNTQLGQAELKAALLAGVDPIPAMNGRTVSNGRLNVDKALRGVSPPWVTILPRGAGELASGASQALTVTLDPKGLIAGEHLAIVKIATNDPKAPVKELQVKAKVSGCRSLTVTPKALAFGAVWTGASKRLALTLTNTCNDFTVVSSIASSHKTFAAGAVPPLRIPPFGMATVEVAYTPDDLVADNGALTIKSNAQDNPVLKVNMTGTGVKPPLLAVDPGSVSLTLDPSEKKTSTVKITNKGGADLLVSLKTVIERKQDSAPAPKLTAGFRKPGKSYSRVRSGFAGLRPLNAHPMVRSSAAGLRVLYLTTIQQFAPGDDQLMSGLRGLPQVAVLDRVDGSLETPNADYLLGYDVVVVSASMPWSDAMAAGDALAEYVDRGGRVCLMVASIASGGGYELLGRIGTPDYLPIVKEGPGSSGYASVFNDHPITKGVASIACGLPTAAMQVQGAGISLGQYENGALVGAVNGERAVVALNIYPEDWYWSGDVVLMLSNTFDYLAGLANWIKVEPSKLVVPAGKTLDATLTFDSEGLDAGSYAAALQLEHNAPTGANPALVPVALTVTARNCLETSVSSVDFGKVWTDRRGLATVTFANPCNRPTQVASLGLSSKVFKTSALKPFEVAAFSEVAIELSYTPDDLTADNGSLTVKSDAKDNPTLTLALKGTGIKPPSISVKPSALSLTLDPGAKAQKSLDIYNAGGDSLRVKVAAKSVEEAGKALGAPKLTAGKPLSLRPMIGEARLSRAHASARSFRPAAGGSLKVLFVNTLALQPEGNDFVRGLRELANVGTVDLLDVQYETPNAAYLLGYDVVLVATDWVPSDPYLLGDALADYVDAGGRVILAGAAFYADGPWGLKGRIADSAYMPIVPGYTEYAGTSAALANHPINAGVNSIYSQFAINTVSVQGSGLPLGNYEYGFLTGALNTEKPVVALNFYPVEGMWGGDVLLMMGNTFDFLGNSIRWMKPGMRELVVAPGKTVKLPVAFTAAEMMAGRFQGLLNLEHNAPQGAPSLDVPVTLTVRAKRCLAAEPASLDFGKVWKDGFTTQWIRLANPCNEATQVTAFRSGDAVFSVRTSAPIVVGPYSSVDIEAVFAPKVAKLYQSRIEALSDAQDRPVLGVAVKGKSVLPPAISVNPASLKETAEAGEIKKRVIKVSNQGGDTLDVDLSTSVDAGGENDSAPKAPALIKGMRDFGSASPFNSNKASKEASIYASKYASGGAVTSFTRPASLPRAKASGFRVLYLTTIVPDSGLEDMFTRGLRNLSNVASLDVVNGEFATPNAEFLLGFDQVVVASSSPFADPAALGDALAEYVDRGGRVCLMTAAISNFRGLGLEGRIATPAYMPMTMEGEGQGSFTEVFEDHPITAGIKVLSSLAPTSSSQVQGDGRPLGYFQSGVLVGAWNASRPVVALNVFPMDFAWKGDLLPMMENIFGYLSKGGSWLGTEPRSVRVAPGGSAEAIISFDGTKIRGGAHSGAVNLFHNVPGKAPVSIPAVFTVGGRLSLAISSKALDFGTVVIGASASAELSLANTGNLPVTVTSALTGNPAFTLGFNPFPAVLEPGDVVWFDAVFTPAQPNAQPAVLTLNATGVDPIVVTLSGLGQRQASLAVATIPAPLRFSVPLGGQTTGQLLLSNLGDEALWYGMKLNAAPDIAKSAAAPASASVYGPEHYAPLAKGASDLRVGRPVDLAVGGPDRFGYRWFDSRETGGPAYAWIDISASGRRLDKVSGCDDCFEGAQLSFPFPFYGASYRSVNVGSNGYLTMGSPAEAFSNHPLPAKAMPTHLVAALFQDLYPAGGGSIWFQDFGDKAVVQYQAVPDFHGTGVFDFEIVLYADGTVDFQYQRLTGVKNTVTVGIQNGEADDGLQVVYNADYLRNKLTVRLRTWLGVPQQEGGLPGLGSKNLILSVDARALPPGTHKGVLSVSGGGSLSTRTTEVPVELIVAPRR